MGAAEKILDQVSDILAGPQRGIVFGDEHSRLSFPVFMRDNADRMKEMGVSTIYVEFDTSLMPLITAAKDDPKAAQELRDHLSASMQQMGPLAGQAHYEMIMAAHAAGMRVVPISDSHTSGQGRLVDGDARFEEEIRKHDDGGRYIVSVGSAHSYAAHTGLHCMDMNGELHGATPDSCGPGDRPASQLGGIDARLGIPSIDFIEGDGPAVEFNQSATGGYIARLPEHSQQGIEDANSTPKMRAEFLHYAREFERAAKNPNRTPEEAEALNGLVDVYKSIYKSASEPVNVGELMHGLGQLDQEYQKVIKVDTFPPDMKELLSGLAEKAMFTAFNLGGLISDTNIDRLAELRDKLEPVAIATQEDPAAPRQQVSQNRQSLGI